VRSKIWRGSEYKNERTHTKRNQGRMKETKEASKSESKSKKEDL
jgi:hypothetical protein